jgi:outer membrane usher protein FimD/PapC
VLLRPLAALAFACIFLLLPVLARAQGAPERGEEMILTIVANHVKRGDFTVLRKGDDFWIGAGDLGKLQVSPVDGAKRQVDGQPFYSLRSLATAGLRFDEADLTLTLDFATQLLQGTRIDLMSLPPPLDITQPQTSVIAGYRVYARHSGDTGSQEGLETDLNFRYGPVLLHQDLRVQGGDGVGRSVVRGATQGIWDDMARGARLTVGDVVTSAGPFGSTVLGGGLLYARHFELTPDQLRQPAASFQMGTSLPADVEVSVDGTVIARQRVGPGPIAVDNLLQYGGTRRLQVTVTDVAGHRQVFDRPFLFTDQTLARGVHDFSYFVGRRAELDDQGQAHYKEAAWQGLHRYGLTDAITLSAGGEGAKDFMNLGAGATVRSDFLGLLSVDAITSRDRVRGTRAAGWDARYAYLTPQSAISLSRRQFSPSFRSFSSAGPAAFPLRETTAAFTTHLGDVTLGVDVQRSVSATERVSSAALRLGMSLSRRLSLNADVQVQRLNGVRQRFANVYLRFDFDTRNWATATAHSSNGSRQVEIEAGRTLSQGEGFGYRAGMVTSTGAGATTASGYGSATWNLRPVTVEVFGTSPITGADRKAYYTEAALSGAIVGVGGYYGVTRRTDDSFVVARLGAAQAGVDVLVNNHVEGKTDSEGKLVLPEVNSYDRQSISVNDKQVGMEYNLREKQHTITLPYRSGAVVDFGARKVHSVFGLVHVVDGGVSRTPPASALTLQGPGGSRDIETSSAGDFYLEDARSGDYTGRLEANGKTYSCRMRVPDFSDAVHEVKEGLVCE